MTDPSNLTGQKLSHPKPLNPKLHLKKPLKCPIHTFIVMAASVSLLLFFHKAQPVSLFPFPQGVGYSLALAQALLGVYCCVPIAWLFIYFRDSFSIHLGMFRWADYRREFLCSLLVGAALGCSGKGAGFFGGGGEVDSGKERM